MRTTLMPLQSTPAGPVTKWLALALLACSLVFSVTQRKLGWGASNLIFTVDDVLSGELWRLATFPLVEPDPFGLIISLVILFFFGRFFEQQWGSRDFFQFFVWSSVGAGVIALPVSVIIDVLMPFRDVGVASGPNAAFDAMLVALAVTLPNSNVMFGFVLPMKGRTIIYAILGIQVITGIMTGATALSVTIGGMLMGYMLVTGTWRPARMLARLRSWRMRRRRHGLYVVPPRRPDRTLH